MEKIIVELLDKHRNYINQYMPNDYYWGIGIENEIYLEFYFYFRAGMVSAEKTVIKKSFRKLLE